MRIVKKIELENFKGFINRRDDILVDADLILLTGKNGVGKTSLLQAITLSLNGYDKNVFDGLDLCNRFSDGKTSRIHILENNKLVDTSSGYSDKDWQLWKSPFRSSQLDLNPSIARVATAYFQDKVEELANGEFLT
jgi:AAA15 family ATPase/GTPase